MCIDYNNGLPWRLMQWRICLQCRRPGFHPWVGKIPWRREWLSITIFLLEEFHGQRSLAGCSPWGLYNNTWYHFVGATCACGFQCPGEWWEGPSWNQSPLRYLGMIIFVPNMLRDHFELPVDILSPWKQHQEKKLTDLTVNCPNNAILLKQTNKQKEYVAESKLALLTTCLCTKSLWKCLNLCEFRDSGHALLQALFLTQRLKPGFLCLLHWQAGSLAQVPYGRLCLPHNRQ